MSNTFTIGKQPDFFKTLPTTTILSDPLFQITLRMLNQQKGADLFSTPSIMLRPHERGKIETIREFIFPAEYEAACLTPSDEIAFRPATPIKFDTVNTGVTTDLTANLAGDRHIHLKLKSTIIEFAGFINYGQPILEIRSQSVQRQKPFVSSANKILMPVLPTRQTETEVTIPDGSTVVFTMIRNERTQIAETTGPLGIKKTKNEITIPRYLTIFLKAQIVEPSGHPADPFLR